MKFTSAPWSVYRLADDVATYGSNAGKCIVTAESGDYEVCGVVETEEDACLIAAAPQLLQACEDALLYLQTARGWLGSTPGNSATERHEKSGHATSVRNGGCNPSALASAPISDSEYQASPAGNISEAASHLRVALLQSHPDDDQIILEHVREALKLLEEK